MPKKTTPTSALDATAPLFFANPEEWRAWLARHHATAREVSVGFHKRGTGKPSLTWPQSVDEALCFGWIDGVRHRVDDERYRIRFTPRRVGSNWSAVNIRRVQELIDEGRMMPTGLAAFEARLASKSAIYSYEQRYDASLTPEQEKRFRRNRRAWEHFQGESPSYRSAVVHRIVSAKQEATRERRLEQLIEASAKGERIEGYAPRRRT